MLNGKISGRHKHFVLVAFLLIPLFGMIVSAWGENAARTEKKRADILELRLPAVEKPNKMPPVWFLHDQHTGALAEKGCKACHTEKEGRFVFDFKNADTLDFQSAMALYHDECAGCHREMKTGDKAVGPMVGNCRSCHMEEPNVESAWLPLEFDRSLHYRHVKSDAIKFKPEVFETYDKNDQNDKNCGACHHVYDEKLEKTVYKKGEEGSCRYCHKETSADDTTKADDPRSYRSAAHSSCVNCHKDLSEKKKDAGPVECAGCHSRSGQAKIDKIKDVPRIKADQPDAVLMASWMKENENLRELPRQLVHPVAFNHKGHEATGESCRTCHHASLEPCSKCHKTRGIEEGDHVTLDAAMHAGDTTTSCVGCHNDIKETPDCAGCHAQMNGGAFAGQECRQCHSIDPQRLTPLPMEKESRKQLAETAVAGRKQKPEQVPDKQIPEKVTIDVMVDAYEAATFPHRKIVHALAEKTGKNRLATVFHEKPETLCMGCHHNSPASVNPPRCISCHKLTGAVAEDGRPGLKGAYHDQCIGCHQQMGIEKPAATDCKGCHKPRIKNIPEDSKS